jgi:GH15 family glucan-1,4-alpha-glucosidase
MTITTPSIRTALVDHSLSVLRAGQSASGAFVASPTFETYRFAWLRDGSFCADALDRMGDDSSAERFHRWVSSTVLGMRGRVERAITAATNGDVAAMLPTRFELDGAEESGQEEWPNFQLDGYGTWLWSFWDHLRRQGRDARSDEREAVRLVARSLAAAGDQPCYDCWEELVEHRHAATLAACAAGLGAAARILRDDALAAVFDDAGRSLQETLQNDFRSDGTFVKYAGTNAVDASLLWLALPFGVVETDDPTFVRTVERVRNELQVPGGGVRRYVGDTFYGGGEWVLLTAWLGWALVELGRREEAMACLEWIESTATPALDLPEQVGPHPQSPSHVAEWVDRWGPSASPLLWSHAMYLVLVDELGLLDERRLR